MTIDVYQRYPWISPPEHWFEYLSLDEFKSWVNCYIPPDFAWFIDYQAMYDEYMCGNECPMRNIPPDGGKWQ